MVLATIDVGRQSIAGGSCRDEMQERGAKWQVRRERLSMGSGLAERSIRAHNLLEYMDR